MDPNRTEADQRRDEFIGRMAEERHERYCAVADLASRLVAAIDQCTYHGDPFPGQPDDIAGQLEVLTTDLGHYTLARCRDDIDEEDRL